MSLSNSAALGALWSIGASLVSRGIGLLATLALTFFVAPEIVGEVGIAYVIVTTVNQLTIIGFGQYIVSKPHSTRSVVFTVSVLNLAFAVPGFLLLFTMAGTVARWFDLPVIERYIPWLILASAIQRIGFIPSRVLARDLQFKRISLIRSAAEVAYAGSVVTLAATGYGGDAIVYANLTRMTIETGFVLASVPARAWLTFSPIQADDVRDVFKFGVPISISALLGFAARRWDDLVIAALFGPRVMGLYRMAYNLADVPASHVGEHIGDVLLPTFARLDAKRAQAGLVRATALLALIVFPMAVGLGFISETLVAVMLPPQWQGVAPLLLVLASLSILRPLGWTVTSYLQARNMPMPVMVTQVFKVIVMLSAMVLLSPLGPTAVTIGVGFAYGAHAGMSLWMVKRAEGLPIMRVLAPVTGPLLACIAMAGVILSIQSFELPRTISLIVEIAVGAMVYIVTSLVVARRASTDLIGLLRNIFHRRQHVPPTLPASTRA